MRTVIVAAAALVAGATQLAAQHVRLGVHGVGVTYAEAREERLAGGAGIGGLLELRYKRFRLEVQGFTASLDPDLGTDPSFDIRQVDIRGSFAVTPVVALELGGGRRYVDPEFAAQEVGVIRVGVLSENQVTRIATLWARGAYLVAAHFTGGGGPGLAVEFGLGVGVGTPNGRVRGYFEYEFQRIDREVNNVDLPIQISLARLGVAAGF